MKKVLAFLGLIVVILIIYFGLGRKNTIVTVELVSIQGGEHVDPFGNLLEGTLHFKNVDNNQTYDINVCVSPRRKDIHIALPEETLADSYTVGSTYRLDLNEAKNTSTSMELYGCYTRGLTPTLIEK